MKQVYLLAEMPEQAMRHDIKLPESHLTGNSAVTSDAAVNAAVAAAVAMTT